MKNRLSIPLYCLLFAGLTISWNSEVVYEPTASASAGIRDALSSPDSSYFSGSSSIHALYELLDLQEKGLSEKAFDYACKGYRQLLERKLISKPGYLTICDFTQSSKNKRLYLLDMENDEVVLTTYVAHGRNSGGEFASRFSNKPSSLQSSLGFYLTSGTYRGEHGLSLRVMGLERGYNDRAMARGIVVHGADYINDNWLSRSKVMGRSYGCPAVPEEECAPLINLIKDGSILFIYHPSTNYLKHSKILNG